MKRPIHAGFRGSVNRFCKTFSANYNFQITLLFSKSKISNFYFGNQLSFLKTFFSKLNFEN